MTASAFSTADIGTSTGAREPGEAIYALIRDLYPICRSITGEGVRQTLARLKQEIPLQVREVPSGTKVFDWTIPREWNIRDAYVKNARGERVIDFRRHNLHLLSYSTPVHRRMSLEELRPHLFSIPERPDWIPYRTSYYAENWGFCLAHHELQRLSEGEYEVCIDSTLGDGHLTYGELLLPGQSRDEILISCHVCHPSLCNDNLSGIAVAAFLAKHLAQTSQRYSYRFLFIPGTIGAITWLALNETSAGRIKHGLVLTCIGDRGNITYKRSRRGDAEIDRAMACVLGRAGRSYEMRHFSPYGYDERQYCSPGFNLAVGCLMRTPHSEFPEYHTSADDLHLVEPASLADSFHTCLAVFEVLENNKTYLNLNPKCEPHLGKRGLYSNLGGTNIRSLQMAMLWILNLSDGASSLLDIAERAGLDFGVLAEAARLLADHGLLRDISN